MALRIIRRLVDLLDVTVTSPADGDVLTYDTASGDWINAVATGGGGGGAPTDVDYLVGTASGGLSAEIVVGTAPGGELGGTWASPTVDTVHSGSSHAATQAAAEATAAAALSTHSADTTGIHGIADTSALETSAGAQAKVDTHVNDATAAHAASAISYAGSTNLSSTDVEAALDELDAEKQPLDTELTALAGLTSAADKAPYFTGSGTAALADLSSFIRTLLDDADASTARATLGVIASLFKSGGAQAIKLDELAATTDVTTLNASTSAHGLLKKLSNSATDFMDGTGAWDTVKDSDLSTSDITTNDVSTSKHGFVPKAPNDTSKALLGDGSWGAIPGASWVTLYDSTLSGTASSFDTGSGGFSTSYRGMYMVALLRTDEAAAVSAVQMTFNGDTGSNYDRQTLNDGNTTISGSISLAQAFCQINSAAASLGSGAFSIHEMFVWFYGQTTAHKVMNLHTSIPDTTAANVSQRHENYRWRSTAAINRIQLAAPSGKNFIAGSHLMVLGIT